MGIHTEFLLDDLENLLLVELLGKSLNSRQSLATISFWESPSAQWYVWQVRSPLTLDTYVYVVLGLLRFPSIVVGLREGVWR